MDNELQSLLGVAAEPTAATSPPGAALVTPAATPERHKRKSRAKPAPEVSALVANPKAGGDPSALAPIARAALFDVFEHMGGIAGFRKWAAAKPDKFYSLFLTYGTRGGAVGRPMKRGNGGGPKVNIPGFTDGP